MLGEPISPESRTHFTDPGEVIALVGKTKHFLSSDPTFVNRFISFPLDESSGQEGRKGCRWDKGTSALEAMPAAEWEMDLSPKQIRRSRCSAE